MKLLTVVLVAASLFVMSAYVTSQAVSSEGEIAIPSTPAPVKDILAILPFTLKTPYTNTWSKDRATVSSGVLIVLEVDPALVVPRNSLEPVLYAGNTVVHRLNHGHLSGRVIGIIPDNIDLSNVLIWFGSPELPERVTQVMVETERARAAEARLHPFPKAKIVSVQRPSIVEKDLAGLLRTVVADIVYEFSPQEKDLAESWRLPVAKAPL